MFSLKALRVMPPSLVVHALGRRTHQRTVSSTTASHTHHAAAALIYYHYHHNNIKNNAF